VELQPRPHWPGQPGWNFDNGFGLDPAALERARLLENTVVPVRNQALLDAQRRRRADAGLAYAATGIGVDNGYGFDVTALSAGAIPAPAPAAVAVEQAIAARSSSAIADPWGNDTKIESTLSSPFSQPQRQTSGGASLDPLSAGMAAADIATSVLPLAGGQSTVPPAPSLIPQPVVARTGLTRGSIEAAIGRRAPVPVALAPSAGVDLSLSPVRQPVVDRGPALSVDTPNLSGGGPGTSTAKGADTLARQAAKRAGGNQLLRGVDSFLTNPAQSTGKAAEGGLRNVSAALHRRGMPGLAGMAKNLAPMARWGVPAAALAGTTVLPAAFAAMDGNEKAGTAGAVLQGGSALAGAAIGQALIPIPGVGAVIGSMAGNALGGGLASGAAGMVEKAQAGDTGLMGNIGRALDPFVDTAFEKEQKAVLQQMNSPAMQAIALQEETRRMEARSAQNQQIFAQAALQGLL
jgi:hypothetical protein